MGMRNLWIQRMVGVRISSALLMCGYGVLTSLLIFNIYYRMYHKNQPGGSYCCGTLHSTTAHHSG